LFSSKYFLSSENIYIYIFTILAANEHQVFSLFIQ